MGAFQFDSNTELSARNCGCGCGSNSERGEVCIIAQKIFDQCRIQKCLTSDVLGPARAARNPVPSCNEMLCEGDIIVPPCNAASVSARDLDLKKIEIIQKQPNPLQDGCWDIELKYVFEYTLEFRRADGCFIGSIDATNSYNLRVTLYGSTGADVTTVTDLFDYSGHSSGGPYCIAEGKALCLAAELVYPCFSGGCGCGCGCGYNDGCCGDMAMGAPIAVNVTIGLFTIVKLFRTVNMVVQSLGRCVPESCTSTASPDDPCGNFESMCFPMDMFSPCYSPKSCCGYGPTYGSPNCEVDNVASTPICNNNCGFNNNCGCR